MPDSFASRAADDHYLPDQRLELAHLDVDVRVDVEARRLDGCVTHTLVARSATDALVLDAVDFEALEVTGDGAEGHYDGKQLRITWERAFDAGEERSLRIRYRVVDPASGILFSSPSKAEPNLPLFAATDHETERARHWLPTVDHPSARPKLRMHVRAKQGLTILANGVHESDEPHEDGTHTAHFRLDHPCPSYLTCFCVGELSRWDGGEWEGVPIAAYGTKHVSAEDLSRSFGPTRRMMEWLCQRLGRPFPYPTYNQFAVPGIGGAMENITLVSWDDRWLLDEHLESEQRDTMDAINLHEMAHAWFGDQVVIADFAHAWLKEGWATYLEACWLEATRGRDGLDYDLWVDQKQYLAETEEKYLRPIVTRRYDSSFFLYDRHLYPGAAWRIHMLRRHLGDDLFWPAVTRYLERFADRTVETEDFRRVLEEVSGRPLDRFFEQWFYRPGYPNLSVQFRFAEGKGTFEIEQKQVDEAAGIGAFDVDLDVSFTVRGKTTQERIKLTRKRTTASFLMAADPDLVRIDPEGSLLHALEFDPGTPRLEKQLRADDVRGRIQAGVTLVLKRRPGGIATVVKHFADEPHYGVQVEWAEALGKAKTEAALKGILSLLERSVSSGYEPRVRIALLKALGEYRDPRAKDALLHMIGESLPPRAQEAAAEALGKQREVGELEALSAVRGSGAFAQAGALRGLGASRKVEAVALLIDRTRTADPRVRDVAATSLGQLARYLEPGERAKAVDHLEDLLRAADPKLQRGAARGLIAARATDSTPALEAYRDTLSAQDAAALTRDLKRLRAGADGADPLKKNLEALEAEVRRLERRVDELEGAPRAADGGSKP